MTKYPHQVDYVVGCHADERLAIYTGNNQGEVYIYELVGKGEIALAAMLTGEPPAIVRNCRRLSPAVLATTTEAGDLRLYEYQAASG